MFFMENWATEVESNVQVKSNNNKYDTNMTKKYINGHTR